ncbi:MAG: PhzF family phenazine biosynthesis protein, partial [Pseudomonadota bacterium]
MREFDIYQVDAFADAVFTGNPAGVVPLSDWPSDALLQNIAAENNLAETAFFKPAGEGRYALRWFTPVQEVPLCGHATLATAHVLFRHLGFTGAEIVFATESGDLIVKKTGDGQYEMDFPADPPTPTAAPDGLADALGGAPEAALRGQYLMAVFADAAAVRALRPNQTKLEALADGRL